MIRVSENVDSVALTGLIPQSMLSRGAIVRLPGEKVKGTHSSGLLVAEPARCATGNDRAHFVRRAERAGCDTRPRTGLAILIAFLLLALPAVALAQSASAGNAHPAVEAMDDVDAQANPFGQPTPTRLDLAAKEAFSRQVDLSPLRDLAVYHNARVKILDTVARETVRQIVGRKDYVDFDFSDKRAKSPRSVHYDPLFTGLDLMIDPGYYADRALIHVEYLPLREAFLDRMYTDKDEREYWKRVGRLKPGKFVETLEPVIAKYGSSSGYAQGLDHVRTALLLYQFSWKQLVMVASDGPEKPWRHLGTLPADSPAAKAAKELGDAWRSADAPRANAAARTLAAELPRINAPYYPTTKRTLEATYNRLNPFEWGYWIYALSLLSLLLAFGTGRKWLVVVGVTSLAAALGMHGFGFISRCIIAERFAIQNQFESMTGLSLFAGLVGAAIMLGRRQWLFGAAAAGVGFMVLITATQTGIPGVNVEREAPILNTSVLLKYHVTTVLVSYGLIALGLMVSLFYLGTHYAAKLRGTLAGAPKLAVAGGGAGGGGGGGGEDSFSELSASALNIGDDASHGTARVLHDLDKSQMIILQLAFWCLGVGILLGAWWADHSWGRWWAFDPKELWALVTWLVYLVVIHVRFASISNRALVTAWLSVLGFIVMLWTYFGVNLILPGLHAYA
jgi:cytochrome c-type biogenesis protein CcsB